MLRMLMQGWKKNKSSAVVQQDKTELSPCMIDAQQWIDRIRGMPGHDKVWIVLMANFNQNYLNFLADYEVADFAKQNNIDDYYVFDDGDVTEVKRVFDEINEKMVSRYGLLYSRDAHLSLNEIDKPQETSSCLIM